MNIRVEKACGIDVHKNEKYSEDSLKPKQMKRLKFQSISEFSLDEMIEIISRAGYTVDKGS